MAYSNGGFDYANSMPSAFHQYLCTMSSIWYHTLRTKCAGFPTQISPAGTFFVTTEPAPIKAFSPMVIPGSNVEPASTEAPLQILVLSSFQSGFYALGYISLVNVTLEPIITLSSNSMPSHTCTPHLMVTLFPNFTSFSIKTVGTDINVLPYCRTGQNHTI